MHCWRFSHKLLFVNLLLYQHSDSVDYAELNAGPLWSDCGLLVLGLLASGEVSCQ